MLNENATVVHGQILLAVLLPTLVHVVVGQGIEPKVMGDSLELHPITVMLCLIFWGMLWGIPGMLLAAPITAAFKIFFESMDTTRPLAKMLAGNLEELMTSVDESDSKDGPKSPRPVRDPSPFSHTVRVPLRQ